MQNTHNTPTATNPTKCASKLPWFKTYSDEKLSHAIWFATKALVQNYTTIDANGRPDFFSEADRQMYRRMWADALNEENLRWSQRTGKPFPGKVA